MDLLNPSTPRKPSVRDCYKCLRECTVKAIKVVNGHAQVVPELCILCGHCVEICPVGAKRVRDDLGRVKQLLGLEEGCLCVLAPSFVTEFPDVRPLALVAALRRLGFRGVSETALGAEEVSAYVAETFLQRKPEDHFLLGLPWAVEYIKKIPAAPRRAGLPTSFHPCFSIPAC
jgi:NAD-dependent dihydropyrimidine dehydrogenase PreA subunit